MKYMVLALSLLTCPLSGIKLKVPREAIKQRWERADSWRVRQKEAIQKKAEEEEDDMSKCLKTSKEIVGLVASLVAIGVSVATFIIGIAT